MQSLSISDNEAERRMNEVVCELFESIFKHNRKAV